MSLLQRLNERAKELNSQQGSAVDVKAERKRRFEQETVPALQELEQFLRSLNETLKIAKPEVRQSYQIPGYGAFDGVPNFEWTIQSDAKSLEYNLEIKWKARVDTDKATRISVSGYERIRMISESFKRLGLGGIRDDQRGPSGLAIQATVQATGFVMCKVHVRAHLDDDNVQFMFENVDQLASIKRLLPVDVIGPDVHDRLGEFILRENDLFVREAWIRGLQAVPRRAVVTSKEPEKAASPFQHDASLEDLARSFSTLPAHLTATQQKPEMRVTEEAKPAPVVESKPVVQEDAQERELDFLAELKFAARYADNAVKKNVEEAGDVSFGAERDFASLKRAFATDASAPAKPAPAPLATPDLDAKQQAEQAEVARLAAAAKAQKDKLEAARAAKAAAEKLAAEKAAAEKLAAEKARKEAAEAEAAKIAAAKAQAAALEAKLQAAKAAEKLKAEQEAAAQAALAQAEAAKAPKSEKDFAALMLQAKEKFAKKYS
jgi:hypothetical protein